MLTVTEFAKTLTRRGAKKPGVSRQHVIALLNDGRIPGAMRIGPTKHRKGIWLIPENAQVLELSKERKALKKA